MQKGNRVPRIELGLWEPETHVITITLYPGHKFKNNVIIYTKNIVHDLRLETSNDAYDCRRINTVHCSMPHCTIY